MNKKRVKTNEQKEKYKIKEKQRLERIEEYRSRLRSENKELDEHFTDFSIDLEIVKLTNNDIRKAIENKEKEHLQENYRTSK